MTLDPSFRPAEYDDVLRIEELWLGAGRWLATIGQTQWQYPLNRERVKHSIAAGECWMILLGDDRIGTVTLDSYADPDFWTTEDEPANALYLHRIIVARTSAGLGIGREVVRWAAERARDSHKKWLRLDAWRSNVPLLNYYLRLGFEHVRTVNKPQRRSGELFQLKVRDEGSSSVPAVPETP